MDWKLVSAILVIALLVVTGVVDIDLSKLGGNRRPATGFTGLTSVFNGPTSGSAAPSVLLGTRCDQERAAADLPPNAINIRWSEGDCSFKYSLRH